MEPINRFSNPAEVISDGAVIASERINHYFSKRTDNVRVVCDPVCEYWPGTAFDHISTKSPVSRQTVLVVNWRHRRRNVVSSNPAATNTTLRASIAALAIVFVTRHTVGHDKPDSAATEAAERDLIWVAIHVFIRELIRARGVMFGLVSVNVTFGQPIHRKRRLSQIRRVWRSKHDRSRTFTAVRCLIRSENSPQYGQERILRMLTIRRPSTSTSEATISKSSISNRTRVMSEPIGISLSDRSCRKPQPG
jgi:hypothetical protein